MSEKIHVRRCYEHVKGDVYMVLGIAKDVKDQSPEAEVVILSNLTTAALFISPVKTFFDKHPQTQVPRFQLVTPTVRRPDANR